MRQDQIDLRAPRTGFEWDRLHAIRRTELFDRYHPPNTPDFVPYDADYPDDRNPANRPLVELLGDEVVGTCRVDQLPARLAALRLVAVAPGHRGLGLGAALMAGAEKVAAELGADALCLNAQPEVVAFYGRLGWKPGEWPGRSGSARSMPMCKPLRPGRCRG